MVQKCNRVIIVMFVVVFVVICLFVYVVCKVCFVAYEYEGDVSVAESACIVEPHTDVVVRVSVCDVVHKKCTCSAAVVAARHRAEPVLACCVPDLKLDLLPADLDDLAPKLNADGV